MLCHGLVVFFATVATGILAGTRDWEFKYCLLTVFVRHCYKRTGIRSEYGRGVCMAARPRIHTTQGVQTKGSMVLKSLSFEKTESTRTIVCVRVCSSQIAWHPSLSYGCLWYSERSCGIFRILVMRWNQSLFSMEADVTRVRGHEAGMLGNLLWKCVVSYHPEIRAIQITYWYRLCRACV